MFEFHHPYSFDPRFAKSAAYFSMEFGIDASLQIYSGGLGYLAGSHMRSAYQLRQNLIGVGVLWKYGYYDQIRNADQTMGVKFEEKQYDFLQPTDIRFEIRINGAPVQVTAYYLPPDLFHTVPIFLLSTILPENDYLARTICHRLYDDNIETKTAASMLLGLGGCKLLEILGVEPEIYHLNESHGLPAAAWLYNKYRNKEEVKKRLVFTNHTPEAAGNQRTNVRLLDKMGFFGEVSLAEIQSVTGIYDEVFDHTLACLRMAKISNGVSQMHGEVLRQMYAYASDLSPITAVTNAQDEVYWEDHDLYANLQKGDDAALTERKKVCKRGLFEEVERQTGKKMNADTLTIVWARRFAGYKRADLLLIDLERFKQWATNAERPVQIIWAGKPYPTDYKSVEMFNRINDYIQSFPNCAVLVGYDLNLSRLLKEGADVWLNNPRISREASGTSGMTAAMNGSVNLSVLDGWIPEFARDGVNAFVIPALDYNMPTHEMDETDAIHLYEALQNRIQPLYYDHPMQWIEIVKNSMKDIIPAFDSKRMAVEYYEKLYLFNT